MKKTILLGAISAVASLWLNNSANAQEAPVNPLDTQAVSILKLKNDLDLLKKIKISGYLQAQFQVADSNGIKSFAGGDFPANADKRFSVRRGRFKIAYDNALALYTIQVDVTEKGVGIKDAYVKITDPWTKALSLQAGVFDRPFGFEISYSSSMRETPERSRLFQTIFPDEREVGAKLTFQPPKTSKWNFLKIEGGIFNGSGPKAVDFDYQKDFIGNIGINKTNKKENINWGIRASYYNGGWRQNTSKVYTIASDSLGLNAFERDKDTLNYGAIAKRQYIGADAQISIDWVAGITSLRAEYIQGQQPGTSSTSKSPETQPTSDTYIRNFNGAYFYFLQNIAHTKHQLVLKYDWYDPNTDVEGDNIGKTVTAPSGKTFAKTGTTDLKYTTIGIGWVYRWDTNVKFTAYYDMVTNETTKNIALWGKDLTDNVFTLRMQYKF
ncbi:MAG: porin [Bacteroidetes bacterium]|nr:MAG: porin [Bacteroidota bacterium]